MRTCAQACGRVCGAGAWGPESCAHQIQIRYEGTYLVRLVVVAQRHGGAPAAQHAPPALEGREDERLRSCRVPRRASHKFFGVRLIARQLMDKAKTTHEIVHEHNTFRMSVKTLKSYTVGPCEIGGGAVSSEALANSTRIPSAPHSSTPTAR